MKKVKAGICLLLCAFSLFGTACTDCVGANNAPSSNPQTSQPSSSGKYTLVEQDSSSEYTIVIPEVQEGKEMEAAVLLQNYIYASSSCRLTIKTDAEFVGRADDSKFISIGKTTKYNASGLNVNTESLNGDGFAIHTVGDDIYLLAGKKANAYVYSAQGLLKELIGWEAYAADEIYYEETMKLAFNDIAVSEIPDFSERSSFEKTLNANVDYKKLVRNDSPVSTSWGFGHTIFTILPPDTYAKFSCETQTEHVCYKDNTDTNKTLADYPDCSDPDYHPEWYVTTHPVDGQLCFSNEEMLAEMRRRVIEHLKTENTDAKYLMIGQMDGNDWCKCAKCTETANYYGAKSATLIQGINYIADAVQEYLNESGQADRELYVTTFAYCATEAPPTKHLEDMKMRPNTAVQIAPIRADYSRSFYEEENSTEAYYIREWAKLCNNLQIWSYAVNTNHYFVPFVNFNVFQDNYRFFKENSVQGVMEQGAYRSNAPGFIALRNYLCLELQWDFEQDYVTLIDNFFDNYYRNGSEYMRKYFDEYREWYNIIESQYTSVNGDVFGRYEMVADAFPLPLLERWEGYVNQAKEDIKALQKSAPNLYEKIYKRLDMETIFFDWVRLEWYGQNYPAETLREMRLAFKGKCEYHEISTYRETVSSMDVLWKEWGI